MTDADAYWAAKIVASFSDAHIRAAVREGHYPALRHVDTLSQALAKRRDTLVQRYFSGVTPLEQPLLTSSQREGLTLSFRDLGLERGVRDAGATHYVWTFTDAARGIRVSGETRASAEGQLRLT